MKAVILAAGQGARLRPLTEDVPKCMVTVADRPMLRWSLDAVAEAGLREAVIVVGYRGEVIRDAFGSQYRNVAIRYVDNPDYATTNNLVSLWLARKELDGDVLLLEADLVYDAGLLKEFITRPEPDAMVVARYDGATTGTVVFVRNGRVSRLVLGKDQGEGFDYSEAWKTVNIWRFSREFLDRSYLPALDTWVERGEVGAYYEAPLGELIAAEPNRFAAFDAAGWRWAESDSPADLERAEALFAGS
ncbi:MAG: phosphocholine cytidylyltransferase family protein [Candidatus Dadabacteria bacterium]|nr:MAG: phosphocholine cytidylyltransferase family protein [Candidatus Dadabacteria bacterium]